MSLTSSSLLALGWHETAWPVSIAGGVLCAGAAMLPDCDHPDGSIAHSLPPFSKPLCRLVAALSGGHRYGTHSLLGIAVFWGIALAASTAVTTYQGREIALGGAVVAVLLLAFAAKVLGISTALGRSTRGLGRGLLTSKVGPWVFSLATAAAITWWLDYRWEWLPWAVALGCFLHIVGDMLTPQGVNWLWPLVFKPPQERGLLSKALWLDNGRVRIPLLDTVERGRRRGLAVLFNREAILAEILGMYIAYLIAVEIGAATGAWALP